VLEQVNCLQTEFGDGLGDQDAPHPSGRRKVAEVGLLLGRFFYEN